MMISGRSYRTRIMHALGGIFGSRPSAPPVAPRSLTAVRKDEPLEPKVSKDKPQAARREK